MGVRSVEVTDPDRCPVGPGRRDSPLRWSGSACGRASARGRRGCVVTPPRRRTMISPTPASFSRSSPSHSVAPLAVRAWPGCQRTPPGSHPSPLRIPRSDDGRDAPFLRVVARLGPGLLLAVPRHDGRVQHQGQLPGDPREAASSVAGPSSRGVCREAGSIRRLARLSRPNVAGSGTRTRPEIRRMLRRSRWGRSSITRRRRAAV